MEQPPPNQFAQISILESIRAGKPVRLDPGTDEQRAADLAAVRQALKEVWPNWPHKVDQKVPTGQIHIQSRTIEHIKRLQAALDKAATSVIERWHTGGFPSRMPLDAHEDRLLEWIDGPGAALTRPWRERKGLWRPDFLIEAQRDDVGTAAENVRICEINSRFPYNAFTMAPLISEAFVKLGLSRAGLEPSMKQTESVPRLMNMFDKSRTLHIAMGPLWSGGDIHVLAQIYREQTGQAARFIGLADLRLVPDPDSGTGQSLFCLSDGREGAVEFGGEKLDRVHQISLEVTPVEFAALSFEMLCQIATCCFNDFRTILLVNDQRFLGVLYDEIDDLASKHHAITEEEAAILRNGLTPSFLPSSSTWKAVVEGSQADPGAKDEWVLKATRDGLGQGHIFGFVTAQDEWLEKLLDADRCNSSPAGTSYALQRIVHQHRYEIQNLSGGIESLHMTGSYCAFSGAYLGFGGFRVGDITPRAIAAGAGGVVMVSVTDMKTGNGVNGTNGTNGTNTVNGVNGANVGI